MTTGLLDLILTPVLPQEGAQARVEPPREQPLRREAEERFEYGGRVGAGGMGAVL